MATPTTNPFANHPVDIGKFDLNNHSSHVGSIRRTDITLIALVGIFVGVRLFVRFSIVRHVFVDDVLIIVAAAFTIVLAAVCLAAIPHGLGTHVWLLNIQTILDEVKTSIQYLFVCQILYACAIASTKMSIIASYLRLIQERAFRRSMYVTAGIITIMWVCSVLVVIFQCRPIEAAWNFEVAGSCIKFVNFLYASSIINIVTDIALCVLPLPYFWRLQLPLRQKLILCLLFCGGAGACVAGILRVTNLHQLTGDDVTFQAVPSLNLSVIECSLGIICVSIPPLRPLAVQVFPALRSNHQRTTTPKRSYGVSNIVTKRSSTRASFRNQFENVNSMEDIRLSPIPGSDLLRDRDRAEFGNRVEVTSNSLPPKAYMKHNGSV